MVTLSELLANLAPEPDEASLFPQIQQAVTESKRKLVVIDDDPTGTQTVHDVELLITWSVPLLSELLLEGSRLFYLLTNSRSLSESAATVVNHEIACQLVEASRAAQVDFVLASRSDSTLRGHYPAEIDALEQGLAAVNAGRFDGHLIVPAFFEGGRYTINNTHYVATPTATSETLLPANETPFARDKVFGYTTAYLPAWLEEKSAGRWKADAVASIGLDLIRQGGVDAVATKLKTIEGGSPIVINAAGYGDLAVVVLAVLQAEAMGKRFAYRTAASFVRLRGAVENRPLLTPGEIPGEARAESGGGVVIVGSYVPDSTAQLEQVLSLPQVSSIELPVKRVIHSETELSKVAREVGTQLDAAVQSGRVGVVYTSRELVTAESASENLEIGRKVSQALIAAIHSMSGRPRFIIAKGGITSHDIAQKGIGAQRALVLGQLFPGVSVWRLESGHRSQFDGIPYIVFPGNVGSPESLAQAVKILSAETLTF